VAWHAELANQKDVKLHAQRLRDFVCHRDPSAWQRQNQDVVSVPVAFQKAGKDTTGLPPVAEEAVRHLKSVWPL
jgi:hypothetical protein